MTMTSNIGNGGGEQFGDTTLTKVFVGGLAWKTPKAAMKDHFEKYGEILEAVIISEKHTGRSKGYGFVTFKDTEAAKKACEDATPFINGRQANCNLASRGARRQQGSIYVGPRSVSLLPTSNVQWYYPTVANGSPYHHPHHYHTMPFDRYNPTYVASDVSYNHKLNYVGGSYMNGHYSPVYPGQPVLGANSSLVPTYHPAYYYQSQTMGLPAHFYSPATDLCPCPNLEAHNYGP